MKNQKRINNKSLISSDNIKTNNALLNLKLINM